MSLDEAQQDVAACHVREREAARAMDAAGEALTREMQAAMDLTSGDDAVERFARWLPHGRTALQRAQAEHRAATIDLDRSRTVLNLARAGVRSVELAIEARSAERSRLDAKKEEQALQDVSAERRMPANELL
ncbi:hypothetical protein [Rhizosaccharibacter radicis]|uniref:Flagellar FliJ protein n=1 Tax=Rhizosaccharibacter radicis TaxID=2782605 RepID=A0ABT1VTH8_9PROT|nr:hypothetical protein [Acetobacteraceae bacterium KSS12]